MLVLLRLWAFIIDATSVNVKIIIKSLAVVSVLVALVLTPWLLHSVVFIEVVSFAGIILMLVVAVARAGTP